jgi:hypothetical protein
LFCAARTFTAGSRQDDHKQHERDDPARHGALNGSTSATVAQSRYSLPIQPGQAHATTANRPQGVLREMVTGSTLTGQRTARPHLTVPTTQPTGRMVHRRSGKCSARLGPIPSAHGVRRVVIVRIVIGRVSAPVTGHVQRRAASSLEAVIAKHPIVDLSDTELLALVVVHDMLAGGAWHSRSGVGSATRTTRWASCSSTFSPRSPSSKWT